MRPRLLHPIRDRARAGERTERRSHERRAQQRRSEPRVIVLDELPPIHGGGCCDPAVDRARSAGGPLDVAVYTCGCGYLFSAAVSTTVSCPHCGTDQAW